MKLNVTLCIQILHFFGAYLFLRKFLLKSLVAFVARRRSVVHELKTTCASLEKKQEKLQHQKEALISDFRAAMSEKSRTIIPEEAAIIPPAVSVDPVELQPEFIEEATATFVDVLRKECRGER